jgi:hypothetical protein
MWEGGPDNARGKRRTLTAVREPLRPGSARGKCSPVNGPAEPEKRQCGHTLWALLGMNPRGDAAGIHFPAAKRMGNAAESIRGERMERRGADHRGERRV